MIVPAFNEEVTIVDSITNLIHCDYPRFEIVVINDGSSDGTLARLREALRLRRTDFPTARRSAPRRSGHCTKQRRRFPRACCISS